MVAYGAHIPGVGGSNPSPAFFKRVADERIVEPGKPLKDAQPAGCHNRSVWTDASSKQACWIILTNRYFVIS